MARLIIIALNLMTSRKYNWRKTMISLHSNYLGLRNTFSFLVISLIYVTGCRDIEPIESQASKKVSAIENTSAIEAARAVFIIDGNIESSFISDDPQRMNSYVLMMPDISKNSVLELANRLGYRNLSLTEVEEEESSFFAQRTDENPWFFAVSKDSGREIAVNLDRWHKRMYDGVDWDIDDIHIRSIADTFLGEHGNVDISQVVFDRIKRTHAKVGEAGGKVLYEFIIDKTVVYKRIIDGIPVIGPGSKIEITVDINGDVSGFIKLWRDIKEVGPQVETIGSNEAVSRLIYKTASLRTDFAVMLDLSEFGLWASDSLALQSHLLPAYNFLCRAVDLDSIFTGSGPDYNGEGYLIKGYRGNDIAPLTGTFPFHSRLESTPVDVR